MGFGLYLLMSRAAINKQKRFKREGVERSKLSHKVATAVTTDRTTCVVTRQS